MTVTPIAHDGVRTGDRPEPEARASEKSDELYEREFTKGILNAVAHPLVVLDAEMRVQSGNRAFFAMFGVSRDETQGRLVYDFADGALDRPQLRTQLEQLANGQAFQPIEIEHAFPEIGQRVLVLDAYQLSMPGRSGHMVLLSFQDITERKQAEAANARLAAIVEFSDDAIVGKNLDGIITSWNKGAERLFGYTAEEIIGKPITTLIPLHLRGEEEGIIGRIRMGQRVEHYETVRRRKHGSLIDISLTVSPVRNAQGKVIGASKIARDITERKAADVLVASQRQALQLLAEGTPLDDVLRFLVDVIERQSADGLLAAITPLNDAGTHFQRGVGARLPDAFSAAVEGVPVDSPTGLCAHALRRGEAIAVRDFSNDPAWRSFGEFVAPYGLRSGWSAPIMSSDGQVLGTFANYYRHTGDPTPQNGKLVDVVLRTAALAIERKRADDALRRSEGNLRDFIENASVGLHWVGPDGIILWANQTELDLLGYTREEYIGRHIAEFHADQRAIEDILQRLTNRETLREYDATLRCKDGSIRHVLIDSNVLWEADRFVHTRCFTRDITERRRNEEQIAVLAREAEHRANNTLAIVQASVHLAQSDTVEGLKQAINGRIQALANVHRMFVQSRWAGADLHSMVSEELSPYRRDDEPRARITGPSLLLKPDTAQTIALTLHELATNAAKHGALSVPSGRIHVEWSCAADRQLVLRWTETGGPPVKPPKRRGFGTRVIESTVKGQLDGEFRFDWRAEGLACEIVFSAGGS